MLHLWRQEGALHLGSERNLLVAGWKGAPQGDEIDELERVAQRLARGYPEGTAMMNVIIGGRPQFTDKMRDDGVRVIRNATNFPLGVGHLILIDGLVGSTIRAFLSTIMLIGRSNRPRKVFGDAAGCAAWLAKQLEKGPEAWTAEQVLAAHVAMLEHAGRAEAK